MLIKFPYFVHLMQPEAQVEVTYDQMMSEYPRYSTINDVALMDAERDMLMVGARGKKAAILFHIYSASGPYTLHEPQHVHHPLPSPTLTSVHAV